MEMFNIDNKPIGKMIIDRNNLIFVFNNAKESTASRQREVLCRFLESSEFRYKTRSSFASTEFLRHDALDHMSPYDRKTIHLHESLLSDVDSTFIDAYFQGLEAVYHKEMRTNDLVSYESLVEMHKIALLYFDELRRGEKADTIEHTYREDKEKEYIKALDKDVSDDVDRIIAEIDRANREQTRSRIRRSRLFTSSSITNLDIETDEMKPSAKPK